MQLAKYFRYIIELGLWTLVLTLGFEVDTQQQSNRATALEQHQQVLLALLLLALRKFFQRFGLLIP
jgi:hypothetical protein